MALTPAEHRALRELHATARQLTTHWRRLAARLGPSAPAALRDGAADARELLEELAERTGAHDLHGWPAAQGLGQRLAGLRGAADLALERNQALRAALLDLQHVVTLLGYLAALAGSRGDAELERWERGWLGRLEPYETRVREAVAALAADAEAAIAPADPGPLGRAGQRLNYAVGALGEAADRSAPARAARRRRRR